MSIPSKAELLSRVSQVNRMTFELQNISYYLLDTLTGAEIHSAENKQLINALKEHMEVLRTVEAQVYAFPAPELVRFPASHHGPQPEGGLIADAEWKGFPCCPMELDEEPPLPTPPRLTRQMTNNHLNVREIEPEPEPEDNIIYPTNWGDDSLPPLPNLSRQSSAAVSPLTFGLTRQTSIRCPFSSTLWLRNEEKDVDVDVDVKHSNKYSRTM